MALKEYVIEDPMYGPRTYQFEEGQQPKGAKLVTHESKAQSTKPANKRAPRPANKSND